MKDAPERERAAQAASTSAEPRPQLHDAVIDAQVSDPAPEGAPRGGNRPWREPVTPAPAADEEAWSGNEATGMSGGGMPEAAGQSDDPGTDTDIPMPRVKKRINVDRV